VKILIADDDRVNRLILQTFLNKWGYDVVAVEDGLKAWNLLEEPDAPRMAILDWMMPRTDGPEICRRVRRCEGAPYTYIILLTAKTRKEELIEGLEAGADDYITKPFDAQELKVRLRAGRRILDLQSRLLAVQETLRVQATHDFLTGIWNRGSILDVLAKEITRARREGSSVGVLMADLDHFKSVNDTYGHLAGDAVLSETVQRMQGEVRSYDEVGRYGGEEFLVVLPRCDESTALIVAERIRRAVGQTAMNTSEGLIGVTISVGAAVNAGSDARGEALIGAADAALYRTKRRGGNSVALAPEAGSVGNMMDLPREFLASAVDPTTERIA